MENQNPRVPPLWEHSLTTLLGHDPTSDPGIALRQWLHFQGVHNILDLPRWDQQELKTIPAQQVYSLDDHGQGLYLRTNQNKQLCGLMTYMKHVFGAYNSDIDPMDDPFHPCTPDEWSQQTSTMLRTYLIQNLPDPHGPEPVPSGSISSSRPTGYSPAAKELMGFNKGIKREIAAYPSLKDERYFDGFKRSLFIVAKSHEAHSCRGRLLSKVSIFWCHVSKIKKWRARLLSIWSVTSGDRFLLSINLHLAHFQIASTTHYSSSNYHNNKTT